MTDSVRPSAALRIARPYASEDELLAGEPETIGRTGILLVGAEAREVGTLLRFDVTLSDGTVALRGEGRVLGFKDRGFRGEPALAVRFTRLDARSKALVDRALARREAKVKPAPVPTTSAAEEPRSAPSLVPPAEVVAPATESAPLSTPPHAAVPVERAPEPSGAQDALERLRQRAAGLSKERVEALLTLSPRRRT